MDTGEYEFPFLQEVFSPRESHKIDFVFVHGLNPSGRNDHPFQTWTHSNGKFWPRDFLAEDIPYARVFVYGYNLMGLQCSGAIEEGESCQFLKGRMPNYLVMGVGACRTGLMVR
ncbi:hypothetical protein DTO003C3_7026 [Penicillium roqueforti]|nr:hypothetical protein DTO003C3_7026 [Penicillium roqueforti]